MGVKAPLPRLDPSDNHYLIKRILRRRNAVSEVIFPHERFQWHLKVGSHDRTPCCHSATHHCEVTLYCGTVKTKTIVRDCLKCRLSYRFPGEADFLAGWVALAMDCRQQQTMPVCN